MIAKRPANVAPLVANWTEMMLAGVDIITGNRVEIRADVVNVEIAADSHGRHYVVHVATDSDRFVEIEVSQ